MKEKLASRKAWFVLAMNFALLLGFAFGMSQEFILSAFLWINANFLGFQGVADAAKMVTGYTPPDLSAGEKLKSRKFWVGLLCAGLTLVLVHFGVSEQVAGEILKWVSSIYLGSQALVDASGSLGKRLAFGKPEPGPVLKVES